MITLARPWLCFDLGHPRRVLSFAPHRPGFVTAEHILWREVRDADLSPDFEVLPWFAAQLAGRGMGQAVGMLTSRDVRRFCVRETRVEGVKACAVATVGLGNAEAIGARRHVPAFPGTINIAVLIDLATPGAGLSEVAQLEALSIAASARTAAIMQSGLKLGSGAVACGTGTDCLAIAADAGDLAYAGLHTALGEAVGRVVYDAVALGAGDWIAAHGAVV